MRNCKAYRAWCGMKTRCYNKNRPKYKSYGARGIIVCDRWKNSFENFLADMGYPPSPNHSLDRIDVNGNYEASNCRWALPHEQSRNMRTNRRITFEGKTMCLTDWAAHVGIGISTLHQRLDTGWSLATALTFSPLANQFDPRAFVARESTTHAAIIAAGKE